MLLCRCCGKRLPTLESLANHACEPSASPFGFEAVAVTLENGEVGVWTDGIGIYSDQEPFCAYRIKSGKKYKVTIQEV